MLRTIRIKPWARGWLISVVLTVIFVLVGCGGRSDEDAYGPRLPDAAFDGAVQDRNDLADRGADTSADAVSDAFDASSIDVSLDVGDGSRDGGDAGRDAD